jgi:hypothetical protein
MTMRYDFLQTELPEQGAQVTPEGWIRADAVLSRCGIFEYQQANGTVRREFRPPGEVFVRESLASLRGVPVTNLHVPWANASAPASIIGTVLTEGRQDGDNIRGEIVIHNPKAMGKNREISLAYKVKLDEVPGTWKGQRYDAVQRRVLYNHCAIVPAGRAGNAVLRLDGDDAAIVHQASTTNQSRAFYGTPGWLPGAAKSAQIPHLLAQFRADAARPVSSAEQARNRMLQRCR